MIEEFMHLMSDPAHLAFEVATTLIIEAIGALLGWPLVKRLVRRHDRNVHGVPAEPEPCATCEGMRAQGIPAALLDRRPLAERGPLAHYLMTPDGQFRRVGPPGDTDWDRKVQERWES